MNGKLSLKDFTSRWQEQQMQRNNWPTMDRLVKNIIVMLAVWKALSYSLVYNTENDTPWPRPCWLMVPLSRHSRCGTTSMRPPVMCRWPIHHRVHLTDIAQYRVIEHPFQPSIVLKQHQIHRPSARPKLIQIRSRLKVLALDKQWVTLLTPFTGIVHSHSHSFKNISLPHW